MRKALAVQMCELEFGSQDPHQTCNPNGPVVRWDVDRRILGAHGPASLVNIVTNSKRTCLKQGGR